MFGISEIAILIIVALIAFGAKKLPELARNAGKSARILKSETKALKDDGTSGRATYTTGPAGTGQTPPQSPEEKHTAPRE